MNFQFTVLSFSVIKENTVLEDRGRHGEASNFAVIIVVVDAYSWHHGLLLVDMLDFLFHRYVFSVCRIYLMLNSTGLTRRHFYPDCIM